MKKILYLCAVPLLISMSLNVHADDKSEKQEALLKAIQLPQIAEMARKAGINPEELKTILQQGKNDKIPAKDMEETLDEGIKAQKEHGPIDNFGAFVQSKLKEGLRGRELAKAIHAEHAARGKGKKKDKGKPDHAGQGKHKDAKQGKPDHAGKNKGKNDK